MARNEMAEIANERGRRGDIAGLAVFLALCFAVSALGGLATASTVGTWYQGLEKPFFNPPNWIFAPVWTVLYVLMAIAGWRVWRVSNGEARETALSMFALQLALNLIWSFLFFGLQRIDLALVDIILLLLAIAAMIALFFPIDRLAARLLVPYFVWVAFAAALNASLWLLN